MCKVHTLACDDIFFRVSPESFTNLSHEFKSNENKILAIEWFVYYVDWQWSLGGKKKI